MPLIDRYDLVILDLDGVVVLGDQAVPGAAAALDQLRRSEVPMRFVTNNASRRADEVATLLTGLGVEAAADEVLTSAMASAQTLAQRFPMGAPVLTVGAPALLAEVAGAGLTPVSSADDHPVAVVQGYGPDVGWASLAEASVAIRSGAVWLATNTDRTLPSPRGPLPGNGALVAALATALGRQPDLVVGKPEPALFETVARRWGAARPLVVGDRLDTDIVAARRAGMDSLLVLTGVSSAEQAAAAGDKARPTYITDDLAGLFTSVTGTAR